MVDVIIFYEVIQREYENALLLKYELEKRGYSVRIINTINSDYYKSFFIKCRVAVIHTIRSDRQVHYYTRCLFGKPKYLVDMQYEQVFFKNKNITNTEIPTGNAREAFHVCWGNEAVNRLKQIGISNDHIWPIGAIQLDLLDPKFTSYYKSKDEICYEYGFNPRNKIVLFNGSFSYINLSDDEISKIALEKKIPYFKNRCENKKNAQLIIAGWIENFLEKENDITFIYRPHPTEKISPVIEELNKKYNNFYIIRDYSVRQWIVIADVINVWDSTSIIEALCAGKKVNACYPIDISDDEFCEIFHGADKVESASEFYKENTNFAFKNPLKIEEIERFYYYNKKDVHIALADKIEYLIKNEVKNEYSTPFKAQYLKHDLDFFFRTLLFDIFNGISKIIRISKPRKLKKLVDLVNNYDKAVLYNMYEEKIYKALEDVEGDRNER